MFDWLRRLFKRELKKEVLIHNVPAKEVIAEIQLKQPLPNVRVKKGAPVLISRRQQEHDVGKFMKHVRQLPGYRKSVKAKVRIEEEEE
jgi:hypothetical protein